MSSLTCNDLERLFKKLDGNGDGLVSVDELQRFLNGLKIISNLDELEYLAGKTSFNLDEFIHFYRTIAKTDQDDQRGNSSDTESDLFKAFEVFDRNRDGFISSEELRSALSSLGLWDEHAGQDVNSMIKAYDANSDGLLDFQEFKKMMSLADS